MKRSLIIGKTNVGKTLFCIQFANYLGIRELHWLLERTDGRTEQKRMTLAEARAALSDSSAHQTRCLQSIHVEVPRGKSMRHLLLTDTTGLTDGIHPEPRIRESMAQTLGAMMNADLILHIVDANQLADSAETLSSPTAGEAPGWRQIDEQMAVYGAAHPGYLMVANKIDLPAGKNGYRQLCQRFSKNRIIPVSALYGIGFREVKQHVWRLA